MQFASGYLVSVTVVIASEIAIKPKTRTCDQALALNLTVIVSA